jgi:hypothetical protein
MIAWLLDIETVFKAEWNILGIDYSGTVPVIM